jgi:parvulin-like peptidyl-prolyl isomerase
MLTRFWLAVLLLTGLACGKNDPVLARVGTRTVTASDFKKEVEGVPFSSQAYLRSPSGRKELMELLVRRKIILEEAESKTPDAETKKLLLDLDHEYQEQKKLLREKVREEQERLRVGQYLKSLKEGPLNVTDADVHTFWEREKEVRSSHILVSDRPLAIDLHKKILAGEKFEALAKTHSEDTASAAKGGDAGFLLPGSLVPEFENALFKLKKGEISEVVASPYGFHLIRRGEDRQLSLFPLDEAMKTRLRRAMESQKLQAWFETIRKNYTVKINNENLQDLVLSSPASPAPEEKKAPPSR